MRAFLILAFWLSPALLRAETPPPFAGYELRLGIAAHDPLSPERGSPDITAEILLPLPGVTPAAAAWQAPRLAIGGALNTAGKTSHLNAGLLWRIDLSAKVFIEAGIGGALHSGDARLRPRHGRSAMGCGAAFRQTAGIGYRLTPRLSVTAAAEHLSNAGLCKHNRGLTNYGIKIGWLF